MTQTYKVEIDFGTVRIPEPTNHWSCDERGFWREHMSDRVVYNMDGSERSREPGGFACVALAGDGVLEMIKRTGGVIVANRSPKPPAPTLWQRAKRIFQP